VTTSDAYNGQIPTDPRTLLLLTTCCYALALIMPTDQAHSFTEFLNTALTILNMGRR
jgi:hypothetical protein